MICFDIGASVGRWSRVNLNNYSKIIAIEAIPNIYNNLKQSLELCNHCECINYVVTNNNNQSINFYNCENYVLSTLNKDLFDNEKSRYYNKFSYEEKLYESITLDKLIEIYGIPDLIKIDAVSGEYNVISSLSQKVTLICFNWFSEFNDISFNCLDYLVNLGFTNFYIQYDDKYDFRPNESDYKSVDLIKTELNNTIIKEDWGMIWCK